MLRRSFNTVLRFGVCVLQKLYSTREWFSQLPIAHMFEDSFAVAVTISPPGFAVVSADPDVDRTVSQSTTVKVAIPAPAVAVRVRVRVPDTASTSIATELSNLNAFCGGSLC